MAKTRSIWTCTQCGAQAPRWQGRCSDCGTYGTLQEEMLSEAGTHATGSVHGPAPAVTTLSDARIHQPRRIETHITELDRVLGGGLVHGSLVLIGGEPGVGKSTLLLQAAALMAEAGAKVLYVCGEESPAQIGLRAARIGLDAEGILLLPETDGGLVERAVLAHEPDVIIVDSIQTMRDSEVESAPGSVSQVRAATARLMRIAKERGITTMLVGHVTKDGSLAGPRVLEHMVDTVLYFEGESDYAFRIIRAVKNRFGPSSEVGIFEMGAEGLIPVASPSQAFIEARGTQVSGSALFATVEGSRPLVVEIQALTSPSYLPVPRRLATGLDTNRLLQVIAVLERRAGLSFANTDVIVSVAGGIRLSEAALDLPLALALISALKGRPLTKEAAAFGEIALTGAIRKAPAAALRVKEAETLGISHLISAESVSSIEECLSLFV